jgi:membrane-bound lytic murein transglycosylase D
MANRASLAGFVVSFLVILAPGAMSPSAADPFLPETFSLAPQLPPSSGLPGEDDLQRELPLGDPGSWAGEADTRGAWVPPPIELDPWAEALAESARLNAVKVVVKAPDQAPAASRPTYPVVSNPQVAFFIDRFTGDRRDIVGAWIARSGHFLDMIRDTLRKHGLPEELAFTAMIESGFNPVAVSKAGAKGLWQFMAATARRYGLRVDQWVDERLDPEKSTVAAAAYLKDLYGLFGSWFLAQAAYNAGENTVARAVRATGSSDFWALARTGFLRRETKEFVPQIQAATLIGREPTRFGFDPVELTPPTVDRVPVPGATDLRWLSASSGISMDSLRSLNAVLVKGVTPPGGMFELKVPAGTAPGVLAALASPPKPAIARAAGKSSVHVVRPRDTVSSIAKRYNVSVGDVVRWNGLARGDRIRPGDRLRVGDLRLPADRDGQASQR